MDVQSVLQSVKLLKAPVGVVGLGYVGLPLACLLANKFRVIGFDVKASRIDELRKGEDRTREVEDRAALLHSNLKYTTDPKDLSDCPVIIVAVPTPVDEFKKPDLTPLIKASRSVGAAMKKGTIVVFESTVYPGVTEKICGKELAAASGLEAGKDFFLGYSPERVNPGDKLHTIDKIIKVVSGSTKEVTDLLGEIYGAVVTAGVHRAPNIMSAEAAKVIENTQRDINIALVNELAQIFERIGLDTQDVLAAARTKWNFLDFRPGLVGGHCIGVDPYYLTHLSESVGIHPAVILSGRHINDGMGRFVAQKTIAMIMAEKHFPMTGLTVAILGVTFKENVPDVRNTKVVDVIKGLEEYGAKVVLYDPVADAEEFHEEYGYHLTSSWREVPRCDAFILAVKHEQFKKDLSIEHLGEKLGPARVVADLKGLLVPEAARSAGIKYWRL